MNGIFTPWSVRGAAGPTFVFEKVEFVRRVLDLAAPFGEQRVQRLTSDLSIAAITGRASVHRVCPVPRTCSSEIEPARLPTPSRTDRPKGGCTGSLHRSSERNIKWEADLDERTDGPDW
jgi:hypothetical protein